MQNCLVLISQFSTKLSQDQYRPQSSGGGGGCRISNTRPGKFQSCFVSEGIHPIRRLFWGHLHSGWLITVTTC